MERKVRITIMTAPNSQDIAIYIGDTLLWSGCGPAITDALGHGATEVFQATTCNFKGKWPLALGDCPIMM